jgi:glycosyltransferase involved in cell wall biosynthesis
LDLSVVIPCFNEALRVDPCLEAVCRHLDAMGDASSEVVCVDDGSLDGTGERLEAWAARRPDRVRVLRRPENAGKGAAVRTGVEASRGDVVVFLDADLAVDVTHVDRVLPALRNGVDVAVGCRHVPGASVDRPQGRLRRTLGRGYLFLARRLLDLSVSDVTCGFKGFRRAVALNLFRRVRCERWGFDAEVLHLAERAGYVVREVPVAWRDGDASTVRLRRDLWGSLRDLLAVRRRSARGEYGHDLESGAPPPR